MKIHETITVIQRVMRSGRSCSLKMLGVWYSHVSIKELSGSTVEAVRLDNGFPLSLSLYSIEDMRY